MNTFSLAAIECQNNYSVEWIGENISVMMKLSLIIILAICLVLTNAYQHSHWKKISARLHSIGYLPQQSRLFAIAGPPSQLAQYSMLSKGQSAFSNIKDCLYRNKWVISASKMSAFLVLSFLMLSTFFVNNARAAFGSAIRGWDLYGRVPYDDWLFKTENLISSDLLKRSYVEAVSCTYFCCMPQICFGLIVF
jgi:hypothetical protein